MTIYVSFSPIGVLASDENGQERAFVSFPKDPKFAAGAMQDCMKAKLSREENEAISKLKEKELIFEVKKEGHKHEFPNPAGEALRKNMISIVEKQRLFKNKQDFLSFIHAVNFELSKTSMQKEAVDDKLIIHAINALDEIERTTNTLAMRLREWYGQYFPEAGYKLSDNKAFSEYVSTTLYRSDVRGAEPHESLGSDISKEDLEEIRAFAKKILEDFKARETLEKYIEIKAKNVCPNTHAILGGMMSARLLAHAGSLERLAKFPASTIQILGAERAFFRFKHGAGSSPKHGVIFNTRYLQSAPRDKKGKVARVLAGKLSIALKLDFYGGEFRGDALRKSVDGALQNQKTSMRPLHKGQGSFNSVSNHPSSHSPRSNHETSMRPRPKGRGLIGSVSSFSEMPPTFPAFQKCRKSAKQISEIPTENSALKGGVSTVVNQPQKSRTLEGSKTSGFHKSGIAPRPTDNAAMRDNGSTIVNHKQSTRPHAKGRGRSACKKRRK